MSPNPIGPFTLRVDDLGPEDHGETNATSTPLPDAGVISGELGFESDRDVFSFEAVAGRVYVATLQQATGQPLRLQHRDFSGAILEQSLGNTLSFVTSASGRTHVAVFAGNGTGVHGYTLTIAEAGLDEHGNQSSTATTLVLGGTATGALSYEGDVDVFRMPVLAGHHQRIRAVGTLGSVTLRAVTAAGATIATVDYEDTMVELSFRTPNSITEVFVHVSSEYAPVGYSLVTEDVGLDDFPNALAEATAMTLGVPVSGVLEVDSDVDTFSLSAMAGK